jgi:uncharacterized tellurite resistance protein B-like protein
MDETTSRQVCEIIAGLIFADGDLHERELAFLARLRARFGLSDAVKLVPPRRSEDALSMLRVLEPEVRKETLSLLIAAAAADGIIHPAERILLGAVAEELDVSEQDLDARLARVVGR